MDAHAHSTLALLCSRSKSRENRLRFSDCERLIRLKEIRFYLLIGTGPLVVLLTCWAMDDWASEENVLLVLDNITMAQHFYVLKVRFGSV